MSDKKKLLVVLCLLVFVFCLAIGFAAFSTTLKINGSARNDDKLWAIYKGGAFFGFTNHVYNCGVRPLITVDKTDLD